MSNPLETMMRECPDGICDGTGMVLNEETNRDEKCPCIKDAWGVEPADDIGL